MFGAHHVRDVYEVAFAFHTFSDDKLLFTDLDGDNITELTLYKNLSLVIQELAKPENVTIVAFNTFNNFTFTVEVDFLKNEDDDED
jgi:hypothetical protein